MGSFLRNLIINLSIATGLMTAANTMEKWAPEHVREQIIEKKEENRKEFKRRVEVAQAKRDKQQVDANNRKAARKRKRDNSIGEHND